MSFASLEYLPFLFVVVALFQFVPANWRVGWLLLASGLFCASANVWSVLVVLCAACASFVLTAVMARAPTPARRKLWLAGAIAVQLGLLALFRYLPAVLGNLAPGFAAQSLDALRGALPLGVSFFTLQHIGYAVDVHRRKLEPCRSALRYGLFGAFFPLLSAGPIERAGNILPQWDALQRLNRANLSLGARRILWGLAKKLVLADTLAVLARPVFAQPENAAPLQMLLAALALFVGLYADFSAYTDIARGSARLFGVELVPNFDRPFLATSVFDFVRRWHMSLMSWITDYVYSPLMRPPARRELWRPRLWRANLCAMGAFGLWHGAAPKFLLVGLAYGTLVSLRQSRRLGAPRRGAQPVRAAPKVHIGGWCATLALLTLLTAPFFAPDLPHVLRVLDALVPDSFAGALAVTRRELVLAVLLAGAFVLHAAGAWRDLEALWRRVERGGRLAWIAALVAAIAVFGTRNAEPFLYFQF